MGTEDQDCNMDLLKEEEYFFRNPHSHEPKACRKNLSLLTKSKIPIKIFCCVDRAGGRREKLRTLAYSLKIQLHNQKNFFFKTHYFVLGTEGGWAVLALEDMSALQTLRCKYLTKKLLSIFGPTHEKLILYEIFVFVMKICKDVANKFQGKIINFRMYEFQGEGSSDGKI